MLSGRTGARVPDPDAGDRPAELPGGAGTAGRASGRDVSAWLLASGALFLVGTCIGDALGDVPGVAQSSWAWALVLLADIAGNGAVVAGIGLVGLFPAGVPETRAERGVLGGAATVAVAVPVLGAIVSLTPPAGLFEAAQPDAVSPLFVPAASFLAPAVSALRYSFAVWVLLGLVLLYLRYRRSSPAARRLIRWLLVGWGAAMVIFAVLSALSLLTSGPVATVTVFVLWGLAVVLVLVSLAAALSSGGLLSTDEAKAGPSPTGRYGCSSPLPTSRPPRRSASSPAATCRTGRGCCSRRRRPSRSSPHSAALNDWPTAGYSAGGWTDTR